MRGRSRSCQQRRALALQVRNSSLLAASRSSPSSRGALQCFPCVARTAWPPRRRLKRAPPLVCPAHITTMGAKHGRLSRMWELQRARSRRLILLTARAGVPAHTDLLFVRVRAAPLRPQGTCPSSSDGGRPGAFMTVNREDALGGGRARAKRTPSAEAPRCARARERRRGNTLAQCGLLNDRGNACHPFVSSNLSRLLGLSWARASERGMFDPVALGPGASCASRRLQARGGANTPPTARAREGSPPPVVATGVPTNALSARCAPSARARRVQRVQPRRARSGRDMRE